MVEKTVPNVFIIESLRFSDETSERFEGRILEKILKLGDKDSVYYYIRTRRELERIAAKFGKSGFRYLHLSCHADRNVMATTLDHITFTELGEIFRPHLQNRRVFLSACEMATRQLAKELLDSSGCYSVIGPSEPVAFSDAALLWSSFYHLMFRTDESRMQRSSIKAHLQSTANLFGVPLNYFSRSSKVSKVCLTKIRPINIS